MNRIILASKSPRRKEILEKAGINFIALASDKEENNLYIEDTKKVAIANADVKASDIAESYPDDIVVGADTIVVLENELFGKPKDPKDAKMMLERLSGKTHQVITGVAIIYQGQKILFSETSDVTFREIAEQEILDYIESKEPMDKAGAYAIQGIGAKFVLGYTNEIENIIGLPIHSLLEHLKEIKKGEK